MTDADWLGSDDDDEIGLGREFCIYMWFELWRVVILSLETKKGVKVEVDEIAKR